MASFGYHMHSAALLAVGNADAHLCTSELALQRNCIEASKHQCDIMITFRGPLRFALLKWVSPRSLDFESNLMLLCQQVLSILPRPEF